MNIYKAVNYGMGREVEVASIRAGSYAEAIRLAEAQFKGAHGLPGTGKGAASKSRVIGIRMTKYGVTA